MKTTPQVWPPDFNWHFRKGEAAVLGVSFNIVGVHALLLRALVESGDQGVKAPKLRRLIWGAELELQMDHALQKAVSELKGRIRRATHLRAVGIIQTIGRGRRDRLYRIDPSITRLIHQLEELGVK
jgi:hypothetical protein